MTDIVTPISSGSFQLDSIIGGGFHRGSLNVIASRPGMGKTTFAMQCASGIARTAKKKIYIVSLEMGSEQIKKKFSDLSEENGIIIDDTPPITPSQIREKLNEIPDIGTVIIDYFQLLQSDNGIFEQNAAINANKIAGELKLISKDFDIPVICTSQLSRSAEERQNHRPVLSDLDRFNGGLVQEADVILFLYRDVYYDMEGAEDRSMEEIIVAKNRYVNCANLLFRCGKIKNIFRRNL